MDNQNIQLSVKDLKVSFRNGINTTIAVDQVNFDLYKGQCLGIVGESGSGKSVTSLTILNLLQTLPNNDTKGSIVFERKECSVDLLKLKENELYKIRGRRISMIFQEPMSALNPVRRCGSQVKEVLYIHNIGPNKNRKNEILNLFSDVSLPDVQRIYQSFPHELSGGQLQRVNIAMALATAPDILICDEPTTALDVTVQKQIILLLKDIVQKHDISLIFISHDLDVIANICDSVLVMYNGKLVERGHLPELFNDPQHPYTQALLACKPSAKNKMFVLPTVRQIMEKTYVRKRRIRHEWKIHDKVLEVDSLKVYFGQKRSMFLKVSNPVKAVDNITFELNKGQILGIVGESGSGKSTVANCIVGLIKPTSGTIKYNGEQIDPQTLSKNTPLRRKIQLVFQDPYSSLNPKIKIGDSILEPIIYHKITPREKAEERVSELLEQVGLDLSYKSRYPHQLSGGQRQRVCIARALAVNPEVLVCDESVSALDVSIQAQILNLLDDLRSRLSISILFISHDLAVIDYLCDYVLVMRSGKIVEEGTPEEIMTNPQQAYTQNLISSLLSY